MNDKLKVLDMSEDEQIRWVAQRYPNERWSFSAHWVNPRNKMVFADLAFRLRDEVKGSEGYEKWSLGQRIVYDYLFNLPENRPSLEYSAKQAENYDDQKPFFADKAKPIHIIIACLIAKESQE